MEQPICPECGVGMWVEGGRTFIKHPVPHECRYAGMTWLLEKKNPKSRKKTWAEFCGQFARTAPAAPPEMPERASKAVPTPPPPKPEMPE